MLIVEFRYLYEKALTLYQAKKDDLFNQEQWTKICYDLIKGLTHLHTEGVLHNDIKSNNVLLKSPLIPIFVDFGKATLRKCPEVYRLTEKQRERYNAKYLYLAHELRNQWGAKTSTATDIYSLGYMSLCLKRTIHFSICCKAKCKSIKFQKE